MFRAYFGPTGMGPLHPFEKDRSPFREFATLDEALLWSCSIVRRGRSVLAIEGDGGTQLDQNEIAASIQQANGFGRMPVI
jgi:hypothetical protein